MYPSLNQKTIVLFKGQSQYDVLREFISILSSCFSRLGFDTVIIDLMEPVWQKHLETTLKRKKVYFFFSMNAVGVDLKMGDRSLYDTLNIPFFGFLVDHPMYHLDRLNQGVSNLIISCIDQTHLDFLNNYLNGNYTKVFIPHGGTQSNAPDVNTMEDRTIDVLFTGSYTNPDPHRQQWLYQGERIGQLFDEVMERALYQDQQPLVETAKRVFSEKSLDLVYFHHGKVWQALTHVDLYIRNRRRRESISSLSNYEYQVEVYGNGWDQLELHSKNINFHPSIDFSEAQGKMRQSKIVLNVLPNFRYGGHERLFTAMLSGAAVVVDQNPYLLNNFNDKRELYFYDIKSDPGTLIESALSDPTSLLNAANEGSKRVSGEHTWEARALKILETVEYHQFFMT